MMSPQSGQSIPGAPVRWGAWLIPVAGIVPTIVFTLWMAGSNPDIDTDPKGAADAATSVLGLGGGIVYILAAIALIFGLFALYAWLAGGRTGTAALAGLVLSVVSVGLLLAAFGAFTLAAAVAADVYRSGDAGASGVLAKLSGGNSGRAILATLIAAMIAGLLGAVAFGVAIWRSGTLPRWSGVLFALGFVLLVVSVPILTQLGGIVLLTGGGWIARTIGQAGATSARTAPTVAPI
jgi:hypothetical protein